MSTALLHETLAKLKGMTCSEVVAGQGTGTAVSLNFGAIVGQQRIGTGRRCRHVPLYEYTLFVQDSTWRVEDDKKVLCSSACSDNSPGSDLIRGLKSLQGEFVVDAKALHLGLDLFLEMSSGVNFLVFSVPIMNDPDAENYSLLSPSTVIEVTFDGHAYASHMKAG